MLRILGAYFFRVIMDCDETYNYWEPMHYMLYGSGMKTWENDAAHKFRSFGYEGLHALFGFLLGGFYGEDKITVFYRVRAALGIGCALCETFLYTAVRARFGGRVALFTLLGLMFSPGMLQSAHSFLPTTFTMCWFMLCWGFWLKGMHAAAVSAAAVGVCVGFPFSVFSLAPMLVHILWETLPQALLFPLARALPASVSAALGWVRPARKPSLTWGSLAALGGVVASGLATATAVTLSCAAVDRVYYGEWTFFQWNTIEYNIFQKGGNGQGSNNFKEPENEHWSWFLLNLTLNFNVFALLAALSPLVLLGLCITAWQRGGGGAVPRI